MNASMVNFTVDGFGFPFRTNADATIIEYKSGNDWYATGMVGVTVVVQEILDAAKKAIEESQRKTKMLDKDGALAVHNAIMALNSINAAGVFYVGRITVSYGKEGRVSIDASTVTANGNFETYASGAEFSAVYGVE